MPRAVQLTRPPKPRPPKPQAKEAHHHTAGWIPIQHAAQLTGLSLRTLQRLIADKRIQAAQQPAPGRRPLTVIHPADVQQLQDQRQPQQFTITAPLTAEAPREGGTPSAAMPQALNPLHTIAALLLAREAREVMQLRPLWLDLAAAAAYTGITARTLRRMARSGAIPTLKDGRSLKFRRADLDKLGA